MTEQIPQKSSEVTSDRDAQVNIMGVGAVQSEVFSQRSSLPRPSEDEIEKIRSQLIPKASRAYVPLTEEQIEENKKQGLKATPVIAGHRSSHNSLGGKWIPDSQYHGKYSE